MYYVYVIKNELDKIYCGSTKDLRRRLREHNQGLSESTKGHVWKLAYYEAFASEKDAREREHKLKHLGYSWRHLKNRIRNSLTEI